MSDEQRRRRLVDPHPAAPRPRDPQRAYPVTEGPSPRQPRPGEVDRPVRRVVDPTPRRREPGQRPSLHDPHPGRARPAGEAHRSTPRPVQDPRPAPGVAPTRRDDRPRIQPLSYEEAVRPRPTGEAVAPREQAWSQVRGQDGVRPARPRSYERAGTIHPHQRRPHAAAPGRPAPVAPPPAAQRAVVQPRPRRQRRPGRVLGGVLVVLLLVVGAVGILVDLQLQRTEAITSYPGRPGPSLGSTWLIVGSDSRQGLTEEQVQALATGGDLGTGRTDTIMIVHKPWVGKATVVSIPRDSAVDIPGYGQNKINAAFALGGPSLLVQTVETATGVRIDHYVEVGFGGFAATVDAVGGVEICPPEPIDDPLAGINLPAGCQVADGPTALGYVRTRATPQGDLDRVARQREFLGGLMDATLSPATLLNPFRMIPLVQSVAANITVDAGDHVPSLVRFTWAMGTRPQSTTVPIGGQDSTDAGAVLLWDPEQSQALFTALRKNRTVPAELVGN